LNALEFDCLRLDLSNPPPELDVASMIKPGRGVIDFNAPSTDSATLRGSPTLLLKKLAMKAMNLTTVATSPAAEAMNSVITAMRACPTARWTLTRMAARH
jgi:hypothetical protein